MEQREKKRESVDQYLKDWDKKNVIINKEVELAMTERKKCEAQIKELQEKVKKIMHDWFFITEMPFQ